jgi:uncharacterized membrane protein
MYGWTALLAFTAVSLAFVPVQVALIWFAAGVLGLWFAVRWPRMRGRAAA